ncbi:hypothetical protein C8R45DRAFT_1185620 [Mycena sanguinolenta]|nr:hypothetical protein C8R45DRAFT_1185620 [Mycena sanguinolenta]
MSLASDWSPAPQIFTQVALGLIIPGLGLTTVLLILYGYAAWNHVSRQYLDRVSFRLLTYALVAHLCFGVSVIIGALVPDLRRRCALLSFLSNLCLVFSAGMFFSIAINLPLVLVLKVNGRKMEKYYVIGVTLIGLGSNLASYVSGNLGWDDINETCWYSSEDPTALLHWFMGSQTVWILLASIGEAVAFMIIVWYLVAHRLVAEDIPTTYSSTASHRPGSTILKFRNIILRIGLYPLVSCIFNISITVVEFYLFQNHKKYPGTPKPNLRLNLAVLAVYTGRPFIYGLLAATDPSFLRALHALRHPETELEAQSQVRTSTLDMSTIIYLPQDEISITEQDKAATLESSMTVQNWRDETTVVSLARTNSEIGKIGSLADSDVMRGPIDVVCHI